MERGAVLQTMLLPAAERPLLSRKLLKLSGSFRATTVEAHMSDMGWPTDITSPYR